MQTVNTGFCIDFKENDFSYLIEHWIWRVAIITHFRTVSVRDSIHFFVLHLPLLIHANCH